MTTLQFNKYIVRTRHDAGICDIHIVAPSEESAIQSVMTAERCPARSILSVRLEPTRLKAFTVRTRDAEYNVLARDVADAKQRVINSYKVAPSDTKRVTSAKTASVNKNIRFFFDARGMFNFARRITRAAGLCDSSHATALKNDIKDWLERVTTKQVNKKGYVVGFVKQGGFRFELHITREPAGAWKLTALIEERKGRYWIATKHATISTWLRTIKQAEVMNELNN